MLIAAISRFGGKTFLQTLFFFLLVTQIGFAQWYQQNSPTTQNLNAVTFIDVNNGFAVGDSGVILHTSNAGVIWVEQTSGTTNHLNDVCFIDGTTGFAVGDSGTILKTDNEGVMWLQLSSGTYYKLNGACFTDAATIWAVGGYRYWPMDKAIILHSIDGGINWTQQIFEDTTELNDIYFTDVNNGWAVGWKNYPNYEGIILRTTNGGTDWIAQTSGTDRVLNDVEFINENLGWVVGGAIGPLPLVKKSNPADWGSGIVLKTTNGGITWTTQMDTLYEALFGVSFVDSSCGFAVGYWSGSMGSGATGGKIVYTSDGGVNWMSQLDEDLSRYRGVDFLDVNTGWVVGTDYDVSGLPNSGIILHTTNGGVAFVEEEQLSEVPTEFLLSQNYPNPYNPSTSIKYQVASISHVSLVVYDILGNEIETLVNEEKQAGTYEISWHAASLPSGVYFYQLKAGEFINTKKMLLLK